MTSYNLREKSSKDLLPFFLFPNFLGTNRYRPLNTTYKLCPCLSIFAVSDDLLSSGDRIPHDRIVSKDDASTQNLGKRQMIGSNDETAGKSLFQNASHHESDDVTDVVTDLRRQLVQVFLINCVAAMQAPLRSRWEQQTCMHCWDLVR